MKKQEFTRVYVNICFVFRWFFINMNEHAS